MTDEKEKAKQRFMEIINKSFIKGICNFDMLNEDDRAEIKELMKLFK